MKLITYFKNTKKVVKKLKNFIKINLFLTHKKRTKKLKKTKKKHSQIKIIINSNLRIRN